MKALTFSRFGDAGVLEWNDVPTPRPAADEAIVRIAYAGLNFADIYRRQGRYHLTGQPPWVLGYEGAGIVESLGNGAARAGIAPGARVGFADSPHANAELVAVPLDKLIPIPDGIALDVAAAALLQGLTAQYLVEDSYRVKTGDVAVVHAAAGGVGLLLCQLAKHAGATVIGIASSPAKRQAVLDAGADAAFGQSDWASELRTLAPDGADVVYDSVGSTLSTSLQAARKGGTVVFYGFAGGEPPPVDPRVLMDRSLTLVGGDLWNVLTSADERRARAARLFAQISSGDLDVRIGGVFALQDGAQAHRLLESRAAVGKLLLRCSN